MKKKLCKSRTNKIIDGVCAGVADYFNVDPTIIRLVTVVVCFFKGAGVLLYILACIVMPYADASDEEDIDNLKSANLDSEEEKTEKKSGKFHSDKEFDSYFDK